MPNKFDAMLMILNKVHANENVTVRSLIDDLGMKERTVLRYIKSLKEAGFPIVHDRERGRYAFEQGFTLRRPSISTEETLTLALAKKVLGTYGSEIGETLGKIEEKIFDTQSRIDDRIVASAPVLPEKVSTYLGRILEAIREFRRLEIHYSSLSEDELTQRVIEPCYIFFRDGFFNVRAYCRLRKEYRTFAIDRIALLKPLDEFFMPHPLSADEDMEGAFGSYIDGEPTEVSLIFDEEVRAQIGRKKWHPSQKHKTLPDGRIEVSFTVNGLEGLRHWMYQWIPHVEVVLPEELRVMLKDDAARVIAKNTPENT
jgi:predicted DNA-binding transcriptional regulator YafY